MFEARVECDSVNPDGVRLTTFVVCYPRCIHSELLTHRMLSRNSASSRAIPVEKMIRRVEEDPFVPLYFGRNQKGMQDGGALDGGEAEVARAEWLAARDDAVRHAKTLASGGVHKQLANRVVEPWMWITVVVTATDWANFFALRCHKDAEPHFQHVAGMMREALQASRPDRVNVGGWHLPFIGDEDWIAAADLGGVEAAYERLKLVSVGRCARVSYETHDGKRDHSEDVKLAERLASATPKHASPFGHVATPDPNYPKRRAVYERWVAENGGVEERWMRGVLYSANLHGWHPFRHTIAGESVPG